MTYRCRACSCLDSFIKHKAMANPSNVQLWDWNNLVDVYQTESDRGALGPLSSFSQRITVAYAFNLISQDFYQALNGIRSVRNHFAHHPSSVTFESDEVRRKLAPLTNYDEEGRADNSSGRRRYLINCGFIASSMLLPIHEAGEAARVKPQENLIPTTSKPPRGPYKRLTTTPTSPTGSWGGPACVSSRGT